MQAISYHQDHVRHALLALNFQRLELPTAVKLVCSPLMIFHSHFILVSSQALWVLVVHRVLLRMETATNAMLDTSWHQDHVQHALLEHNFQRQATQEAVKPVWMMVVCGILMHHA